MRLRVYALPLTTVPFPIKSLVKYQPSSGHAVGQRHGNPPPIRIRITGA
jgi:hypothetical protein